MVADSEIAVSATEPMAGTEAAPFSSYLGTFRRDEYSRFSRATLSLEALSLCSREGGTDELTQVSAERTLDACSAVRFFPDARGASIYG
jgi:hypothetical protein